MQRVGPIDDFAIGVVGLFGAEGGPTDEAFEHDCSHRPPVAAKGIALTAKDLGSYIVGSADRGVCHDTAGFAPGIDLAPVAHRKVNLVQRDRVSIATFA